jgi:hypothetical protein
MADKPVPAPAPDPPRRRAKREIPPMRAQIAECNCPEFCERDHDNE